MITRLNKRIQGIPVDDFAVMDADPHGQFIAIYLQPANCIHIIKTFRFTHSAIDFMGKFMEQSQYDEFGELKSDAEISSQDLYAKQEVEKIVISSVYNSQQLILVSNYFNIKIFSIQFEEDNHCRISLKKEGQIHFHRAQPLQSFIFHDGELWVSFLNGKIEIYSKVNLVWLPKHTQKIKRQSIRLFAYKNLYEPLYDLRNFNQQKQNGIKRYPLGKPSRCKKQNLKKLSFWSENLQTIKALRSNYNRSKPFKKPQIIYISRNNTLCRAYANQTFPEFQITQLCTSNKRPSKFNNEFDEYMFQKMKSCIPIPYIASPSRNYIVCSEIEGFSIISKRFDWRKILYNTMYPTINPFFEEFLLTIFNLFHMKMTEEEAKKVQSILSLKYQFLLVLFSKEDYIYQEQYEEEKSSIRLQLIACRKSIQLKPSQKESKSKKNITKTLHTSIEAQRFKLMELKMTTEDPQAIRWISPTQILYFARKDQSSNHQLHYAMFKEDVIIETIMSAFEKILVSQFKKPMRKTLWPNH